MEDGDCKSVKHGLVHEEFMKTKEQKQITHT